MSKLLEVYKILGLEVGDKINLKYVYSGNEYPYNPFNVTDEGIRDCEYSLNFCALFQLIDNKLTYTKLPKQIELTEDEKVILRNINSDFKYIARDKDTELYIFEGKPQKVDNYYSHSYYTEMEQFNHLFKNITFESGAHRISDLLK